MKNFLLKVSFCVLLFGVIGCNNKYDKEKLLKFNHLYHYEADKAKLRSYYNEIEKFALNINQNAVFDVRYNLPDRVFFFPFEVNFEHIKGNQFKSYIFRLYHKDDAISYLNWYKTEKKNFSCLPKKHLKFLNENKNTAKKIIIKCERNKNKIVKIDNNIDTYYTRYYYQYKLNDKNVFLRLINCDNQEGQMVINQITNDDLLTQVIKKSFDSFTFNKNEIIVIQKQKEEKSEYYILTFERFNEGKLDIKMSLINSKWEYKFIQAERYN